MKKTLKIMLIATIILIMLLAMGTVAYASDGTSAVTRGADWNGLLYNFLTQILPIIVTFIGSLIVLWKAWLKKHIANKEYQAAALYATDLIATEVGKAEQVIVKSFKAAPDSGGKLTADQGAQIKAGVLDIVKKQLPADICSALKAKIPDVAEWLDAKVEKEVQKLTVSTGG